MMIKYTKKDVRDMLRKELKEYEAVFGYITPEERKGLCEWVAADNSVNDNPYLLYGENGWSLDYINAIRINDEMILNPEGYQANFESKLCYDADEMSF